MDSLVRFLFALALAALLAGCGKPDSTADPETAQGLALSATDIQLAALRSIRPAFELPAVVEAVQHARIRPEVTATLKAFHFTPGSLVEKGELLIELDDAKYRAALDAAEAELQSAMANAAQAQTNWQRARKLMPKGYISALDYDKAEATVGTSRAAVAQAEAGVEQAQLDLEHTQIHAPFSGRISKSRYAVGDLVAPSSPNNPNPLFELVQLDPIYAAASVAQDRYSNFVILRKRLEKQGTEIPELEVTLNLPGGEEYYHKGTFENWSHASSGSRGMITGRVLFPNPDGLLLPGENVTLVGKTIESVSRVVVPQKAVFQDQQGHYVMVVDQDNIVRRKNIEVGIRDGADWAVRSGLEEGVIVIAEGAQGLKPGTLVTLPTTP